MYNTYKLCGEDPAEGINRRLFREDSMKKQKISDAVIHRLPRYYRYLDDLYNKGVVRISSSSLGDKMDITASQIRQDLSCFGEFGQQGYGYNVAELRAEIGHILGIDNGHRLIIIDVSPALGDTQIRGVTIRPMDQLAEYVARYRPNVAVLTVPQNVAQPLADQLIDLGIRGFWNFTNVELSTEVPGVFFPAADRTFPRPRHTMGMRPHHGSTFFIGG